MRLRDLDARFVHEAHAGGSRMAIQDSVEGMQGVMFQCPSCAVGMERGEEDGRRFVRGAHYIRVFFANPRGVEPAPPDADLRSGGEPNPRWQLVSGSTIDDITLAPSINCDIPWTDAEGVTHESACKFHGWVKDGEAS